MLLHRSGGSGVECPAGRLVIGGHGASFNGNGWWKMVSDIDIQDCDEKDDNERAHWPRSNNTVVGMLTLCCSYCGKTDAPMLGRWGKVWRLSSKVDVGLNLNGDNLIFLLLRRCETFCRLVVGRDLNSKNYLFESVFRWFEQWRLDGGRRRCPAALGMMRAKTL